MNDLDEMIKEHIEERVQLLSRLKAAENLVLEVKGEMQQIEGFAKYVTPANIDTLLADYSGRVRVDGPAYAAIMAIAAKLREAWVLTEK